MDVEIVTGGTSSGDELRSLWTWLLDEPEFRGRVTLREAVPRRDEMGLDVAALLLAFAGGGGAVFAATTVRTLGNVIVTWMKARTSPVDVTVRWANGAEVTLTADEVGGLSADGVARLLDDLTKRLGPPPLGPPPGDGNGGSGSPGRGGPDGPGGPGDPGEPGGQDDPGGPGDLGGTEGSDGPGGPDGSDGSGGLGDLGGPEGSDDPGGPEGSDDLGGPDGESRPASAPTG